MKPGNNFFFTSFFVIFSLTSFAQTLPIGTPLLEETWRRLQIAGERDINISFTIRPVYAGTTEDYDSMYYPQNLFAEKKSTNRLNYAKGKGIVRLLPISLKQQYNTHHPYGWNDASMIQGRGYQAQLSVGVYSKIGPLSVQLQPELVYAQNKDFSTFPYAHTDSIWRSYYHILNRIDDPEKYGNGSYAKIFPGQSSLRIHYKKLSLGLSTENLWWGPGIRNSLLMSNNAPGFPHITFNTSTPVISSIGSFEWQVIGGRLKGSGILPPDTGRTFNGEKLYEPKPGDDRYLNGMIITWQPKWTKGLHLGFARVIYQYTSDTRRTIDGYLPVVGAFFKGNTANEDDKKRDQLLSVFFRLVLPKEKAEFYAEFGRNDHSQNVRDLLLEPEHARAYIIGGRKIFATKKNTDVELMIEFTQLQNPATANVRELEGWYTHYQVRHGYTHMGQVIGAGIGPGASSQTIGLNWIKGIKKFGVMLERVVRNNDFYYSAFGPMRNFGTHWVDLSINAYKNWYYKRFIYAANLSFVRSLNYQWRYETDPVTGRKTSIDANNLHANFSVCYLF